MDRWNDMREVGGSHDTGNVEYFRALKRSSEGAASVEPAAYPGDKRRNPRYKCEGSAEFRSEGSTVRTWATVTDLSRSGCYVEMQATSPVDTPLSMTIEVAGIRVRVKGVVRVSYPFLGMGIAFTEVSNDDQAQFDELLTRLASGISETAYKTEARPETTSSSEMASVTDPRGALKAVAAFFQEHHTLTREQFAELVEKYGGR
jgi:hypothetical protein